MADELVRLSAREGDRYRWMVLLRDLRLVTLREVQGRDEYAVVSRNVFTEEVVPVWVNHTIAGYYRQPVFSVGGPWLPMPVHNIDDPRSKGVRSGKSLLELVRKDRELQEAIALVWSDAVPSGPGSPVSLRHASEFVCAARIWTILEEACRAQGSET